MRTEEKVKRRIYWVAETIDEAMRFRGQILERHGFEIRFFSDTVGFKTQVDRLRPAIVLVSCSETEEATLTLLRAVASIQAIRATKMVLVGSKFTEAVTQLASCLNVRDIIPFDKLDRLDKFDKIDETEVDPSLSPGGAKGAIMDGWTQRLLYATAPKPKSYSTPSGQLTSSLITELGVPGRITWIAADQLCIETRARLKVGSEIRIAGRIATEFSVPYLRGQVLSSHNQRLKYHFSGALLVRWEVPDKDKHKVESFLTALQKTTNGPRIRVFLAIQNMDMRAMVMALLDDSQYEVATALTRGSIAEEPRYFTPDLVIIESKLAAQNNWPLFIKMMKSIPPHALIIVLGADLEPEKLREVKGLGRIQQIPDASLERQGLSLSRTIYDEVSPFKAEKNIPSNASFLPSQNPMSEAEILIPGTISALHPVSLQIRSHEVIDRFALIRIIHPLLREVFQRHPYFKVTSGKTLEKPPTGHHHSHEMQGYLTDVTQEEISVFSRVIWQIMTKHLTKYLPENDASAIAAWTQDPTTSPLFSWELLNSVDFKSLPNAVSLPTITPKSSSSVPLPDQSPSRDDKEKSTPTKPQTKGHGTSSVPFSETVKAILIVGTVGLMLWILYAWLAPRIGQSGGVYSEQLKKFAPHLQPQSSTEP